MWFAKGSRRGDAGKNKEIRNSGGLYIAVGLGLFFLGLFLSFYLAFPNQPLKQRLVHELEARLPIQVELAEATWQPLLTLAGKGMAIRQSDPPRALFHVDSFAVAPQWLTLFTGDPGLTGAMKVSTGELAFSWRRSGALTLIANSLPLDIPLATSPETRFSGNLASGEVTTSAPLQSTTESQFDIQLRQVSVLGLEALTANPNGLHLGEISLQMSGQGTSLTIARLEATGGDLVVSGNGTLMLVTASPENSRINLNLTVRAGSQADPTLAGLLELVGTRQADGSRKLRLTGSLAKPVIR